MRIRPHLFAGLLLAALLPATPSFALLVQPIVIDMSTNGARSNAALTVVNDRRTPETVEITIGKLTLPERGAPQITEDKGDDFLVFPPRATIAPGKTQVFRIRWIGDPALAEGRTYMFSTTELPVDANGANGIQLLYSIQSLVTVNSPNLKPDVRPLTVARSTQAAPKPEKPEDKPAAPKAGVEVTFSNTGPASDYLSKFSLKLKAEGSNWSKTIASTDLAKSVGLGLIAPNSRRIFFIELDGVPASGALSATLERAPQR
jgi:fimbrial chaperone protein